MDEKYGKIIYEDEVLLVINKSIGMPVQTSELENPSLEKYLNETYESCHIINRIDQVVSGIVLVSKDKKSASVFTKKLKDNLIIKNYFAIVEGHVSEDFGTLTNKLIKKGSKSFVNREGKASTLHYKTVKKLDKYTILSISIDNGRFHQIRCQLAHFGHPIKGDVKYGSRRSNPEKGIYLHADSVVIKDYPTDDKILIKNAEYPKMSLWNLV